MRASIRDITEIQIGYQFREKLDMASDGTHQVIQVKDIDPDNDHRLVPSSLYRVTPKRDASRYEVANGDVIFLSKGRRNFATLVDSVLEELPWLKPDGSESTVTIKTIVAGYFFILHLNRNDIDPAYLVWVINQPPAQSYLQSVSRGSGMPFIPKDAFADLEINIPPMDVQRKIVELHYLSRHEQQLIHQLATKRAELVSGLCLSAARQDNH